MPILHAQNDQYNIVTNSFLLLVAMPLLLVAFWFSLLEAMASTLVAMGLIKEKKDDLIEDIRESAAKMFPRL